MNYAIQVCGGTICTSSVCNLQFACVLHHFMQRRNLEAHIIGKFVAYAAVVAANCVNIPIIRQKYDKCGWSCDVLVM